MILLLCVILFTEGGQDLCLGVSVQESLCPVAVFVQGGLCRGGLCPGGSLSRRPPRYSGRAGSTHPTRMHSCFV